MLRLRSTPFFAQLFLVTDIRVRYLKTTVLLFFPTCTWSSEFCIFRDLSISPLSASGSFHQTSIFGRLCCPILAFSFNLVLLAILAGSSVC